MHKEQRAPLLWRAFVILPDRHKARRIGDDTEKRLVYPEHIAIIGLVILAFANAAWALFG